MKRNIFNTILVSFFVLIFIFSFKNVEAEFKFTCSARQTSSTVNINVGVINGNSKDWKIGVLEDGKSYSPELVNFKSVSDVLNDTEFITTYNFSVLKQGIKYNVLIFSKILGKYETDLKNCNFTVPPSVDGSCGTATGKSFESKPTSNLCKSGEATEVEKNYNKWTWSCNGDNGGKNVSCTAIVGTKDSNDKEEAKPVVDASSTGGGLVPDCPAEGCGFNELMILINNAIKFLLFTIATPLAALIFVYAGVMLLTSNGNPQKMTTAKTIMKNLIIGYVIALAAWLIINTILTSLGYSGPTFLVN